MDKQTDFATEMMLPFEGIYTDGFKTYLPDILFEMLQLDMINIGEMGLIGLLMGTIPNLTKTLSLEEIKKNSGNDSVKKIKKYLEGLAKPFTILNGKSLIQLEHLEGTFYKITINDIWKDNHEYFINKSNLKLSTNQ